MYNKHTYINTYIHVHTYKSRLIHRSYCFTWCGIENPLQYEAGRTTVLSGRNCGTERRGERRKYLYMLQIVSEFIARAMLNSMYILAMKWLEKSKLNTHSTQQ